MQLSSESYGSCTGHKSESSLARHGRKKDGALTNEPYLWVVSAMDVYFGQCKLLVAGDDKSFELNASASFW